jgi:cardiolipin synthase
MTGALPQLIVQPDDGVAPVLEFIRGAQRSLLIKQFTFSDSSLIDAVTGNASSIGDRLSLVDG